MSPRFARHAGVLALVASSTLLSAQAPQRAVCELAPVSSLSTETTGLLLSIPGVADDFVLYADGQWLVRGDGSAHLSVFAQRAGAFDRDLFVELNFRSPVGPGKFNYPPIGSPITTMLAQAYAPTGSIDPSTWQYYTQVTGTITGLRAFQGLRATVSNVGNAQVGPGASNKNEQLGLAVDLQVQITQPSQSGTFQPTGPLALRANLASTAHRCAMHVEPDAQFSAANNRLAVTIPGLGDYLFLPRADLQEFATGQVWLQGTLRHRTNFEDAWLVRLTLDQVVDPGTANFPPQQTIAQELLGSAYAANGGPIDPMTWRYYLTASGLLRGIEDNDGAIINLSQSKPAQLGLGAGQGNAHFGLSAQLTASVGMQPFSHTIAITDDVTLRANVTASCIQPMPWITYGDNQTIKTVTDQKLLFKGVDLGFIEQGALSSFIVGADARRWFEGNVRVVDHNTVEFSIPQALAPGTYPLRFLNATRLSNQLSVTLNEPTTVTMHTESDRLPGETQHYVTHQGSVQGFAFCFVILSSSHLPSMATGILDLEIGNQFTDYQFLNVASQDPLTRASVITMPAIPATLQGFDVHAQSALMDQTFYPLIPSNAATTHY